MCPLKACVRGAVLPPFWEPKCQKSHIPSSWHWHHTMPLEQITAFYYKSEDWVMCSRADGCSPLGAGVSDVQSSWGSYSAFGSSRSFPLSDQQRDEWSAPQSLRLHSVSCSDKRRKLQIIPESGAYVIRSSEATGHVNMQRAWLQRGGFSVKQACPTHAVGNKEGTVYSTGLASDTADILSWILGD